jgi:hypothetical protein
MSVAQVETPARSFARLAAVCEPDPYSGSTRVVLAQFILEGSPPNEASEWRAVDLTSCFQDHIKEERAASIKRKCVETLSDLFEGYREVTTVKIVWDIPTPGKHGPAETLRKEHGLTDCNLDNNLALLFKGKGR